MLSTAVVVQSSAATAARVRGLLSPQFCVLQEGATLGSSLRCHYQMDEYPEMHCTGTNLALDLRKFEVRRQILSRVCGGVWAGLHKPSALPFIPSLHLPMRSGGLLPFQCLAGYSIAEPGSVSAAQPHGTGMVPSLRVPLAAEPL